MFQQSVRIIFACLFVTGALVSDPATCTTTIPEEVRCAIGALLLGSASEADDESTGPERIIRAANRHRDRETWKENSAQMSGKKFRKRFKVSRQRFSSLADLIAPHVEPDSIGKMMAEISSGSYIPSEVYLAVTLRWLSGSHFSDLEDLYGVEENGAYTVVWKTLAVLDKKLKLNDFNPWDLGQCKALAQKMYIRSKQTIAGCIGALDGMAVRIYKPRNSDAENSLHFLNRKGFFSINLQAIADADWKFLWYSMETAGGTHDSLAFKVSELGRSLEDKGLPKDYWIAGDDAYACSEYLLTPYAKQSCRGCRERDDFNFYQSRCRINVECAFGLLVQRFGVLRRPMRCKLERVVLVVSVCMKLHNILIDDRMHMNQPMARDVTAKDLFKPIDQDKVSYMPRDLKKRQKCALRQKICDLLKSEGRPSCALVRDPLRILFLRRFGLWWWSRQYICFFFLLTR